MEVEAEASTSIAYATQPMRPRVLTAANLLFFTVFGALLIGGVPASTAALPQDPGGLFVDAPGQRAPGRSRHPSVIRSRPVTISASFLAGLQRAGRRGAPPTLLLNLFDDVSLQAVLDRAEDTLDGVTWAGRVPGRDRSSVTLAIVGDAIAGSVIMPGAVYAIRHAGGGVHEVVEVDQAQFPPEAQPVPVPASARAGGAVAGNQASGDPAQDASSSPVIDVMVLYTPAASAEAGGPAAIAARINLGVGETNTSYANSNVAQRLRLVHVEEVAYTEHNDLGADLDNLTNHDGSNPLSTPLGNAAALRRDVHGADLVVLVTAPPSPTFCGIAWVMESVSSDFEGFAFSVVEQSCISPNGTFGHELGHLMGARHDWYVDNATTPHTYAHGYVNAAARWRTVMAYDSVCAAQSFSCTRLLVLVEPRRCLWRRGHGDCRRHEVELPDGQRQQRVVRCRRPPDAERDGGDRGEFPDRRAARRFRFHGRPEERHPLAPRDRRRRVAVADGRRHTAGRVLRPHCS